VFSIVAFHSFWPLNLDKFKIQININLFPIGGNEISTFEEVASISATERKHCGSAQGSQQITTASDGTAGAS